MQTIKGGYKKIEFDEDEHFYDPCEIQLVLKAGTQLQPQTPTEELADGMPAAVLKSFIIGIRSADNNSAAGSAYARLKAAEESRTKIHFRFLLFTGNYLYLFNAQAVVDREVNEVGKFNALKISGVVIGMDEYELFYFSGSVDAESRDIFADSESIYANLE